MLNWTKEEEKRGFPRIKAHVPLHYQIRGTAEFDNTVSDDISTEGISFVNDSFIAPESSLALQINVLSRVLNPIGKIVWSAPIAHSDRYRLGVKFLEFNPLEKRFLGDYIDLRQGKLT